MSQAPLSAPVYDFDRVVDRRSTGSLKWNRYGEADVLPMWVADMDFTVAPAITEALHARVDHGIFGYTRGYDSVAAAVVEYVARVHGVTIDPSWIVWMPGMVPGLAMASAAFGERGDSVMTFTPVYPPFLHAHRDALRGLITVPLREENGLHTFDFPAMEAALTPKTRLIILCSPHNPVGRVWTRAELEELAAFCVRHDLYLCSDEIHCDLLLEPETSPHTSALRLGGAIQEKLIVMMAASKTYNVPGLGLSFSIIPNADTRRRFQAAKSTFVAETNPLGFAATEAAYRHGEPWRVALCEYLRGNRDFIVDFLARNAPEVKVAPVQATYLAWLDVSFLGLANPAAHFEKHGLGLSPGSDFAGPGFVRLNFGCPRPLLEKGLERLVSALAK